MTAKWRNLLKPLILGLLTLVLALLWLWSGAPLPARANGSECRVCPEGLPTCTYTNVQAAVDDNNCTEI